MSRMPEMSPLELRLLDEFQRDFPLVSAPYAVLAGMLETTERTVLDTLERLSSAGAVSRIGAVFRPGAVGASTLAALAVPREEICAAAALVSAFPEVSHNYERENAYNLWFVAMATDAVRLDAVLGAIEARTGRRVLRLPLVEEYHIDLGFRLRDTGGARPQVAARPRRPVAAVLTPRERRLVSALQPGLPLVTHPYAALGEACGLAEEVVIGAIARWQDAGIVRRFGVVVRHRELGFGANAMAVWDVPDDTVGEAGMQLAREQRVTLAYCRARSLPQWPYNLYCMVHGRERAQVEATLASAARRAGLGGRPHAVLFSRRRFKQASACVAPMESGWTPSIV
ncbi:MAG: Lrp/AsnC family transcriptional regulator [Burkholderiales bacterium]